MPQPPLSRNHHFLPRCYLGGFSTTRRNGECYVSAVDRDGKQFAPNIINVAQQHDFNRIDAEGYRPDAFEQGLASFEGEFALALERIIERRSLDQPEERNLLMNFLAWIAVHNPRQRETWRDFQERVVKRAMDLMTATEDIWKNQTRKAAHAGYLDPEKSAQVSYQRVRELVAQDAFRVEVPTEHHLGTAIDTMDAILPTMARRRWRMVVAPPSSGGFVTSDHPVTLMWADPSQRRGLYPPGYGVAGTQVIFPISHDLALLGAFDIDEQTDEIDAALVAQINGVTISHCERQVYARSVEFSYQILGDAPPQKGSNLSRDTSFIANDKKAE